MSGHFPAPSDRELARSPVMPLEQVLGSTNQGDWSQRNLEALADMGRVVNDPDRLGIVESVLDIDAPIIGAIQRRINGALLMQTYEGPDRARHAWRQIVAVSMFAVAAAKTEGIESALQQEDPQDIDAAVDYVISLTDTNETETRGQVFQIVEDDDYLKGLFQNIAKVEEAAVNIIQRAESEQAQYYLRDTGQTTADVRMGYRLIPAVMAHLRGVIPEASQNQGRSLEISPRLVTSIFSSDSVNKEGAPGNGEETAEIHTVTPIGLHEVMAAKNYQAKVGSLTDAFEDAQGVDPEGTVQRLLEANDLAVINEIREAIIGSWHVKVGSEPQEYGITVAANALAFSFGRAKPGTLEVLQSLELLPKSVRLACINAVLDSPLKAASQGPDAIERAQAMATLTGRLKSGATSLTVACKEFKIKPIIDHNEGKTIVVEPGIPLLNNLLAEGVDASARLVRGGVGNVREQRIQAAHAGGLLYGAIFAELLKVIPRPDQKDAQPSLPKSKAA